MSEINSVNILVMKVSPDAVTPQYMTSGASGVDLYASKDVLIRPGQTELVPTGLVFKMPSHIEMQIRPRSGVSYKTMLIIPNSPGTIDSDYRGEVMVIMRNTSPIWWAAENRNNTHAKTIDGEYINTNAPLEPDTYLIKKGDRIAQGVFQEISKGKFNVVDNISDDSERGSGGFGHTGTN